MNKKRIVVFICVLLIITIFTSSLPVTATKEKKCRSESVFSFGAFLLTATDIEGITDNDHLGGLSDLDIIATSQQFMIATFPIWGTTIIEYETEIHITIENFLGIIETDFNGQTQVMGICKNIAWEII